MGFRLSYGNVSEGKHRSNTLEFSLKWVHNSNRESFYQQLEKLRKKKTKEQLKAGGCATKQMGFGKREEKRKKNDFRRSEKSKY